MRAAGVSGEGQALAVDAVTGALLVLTGGIEALESRYCKNRYSVH